MWCGGNEGSEEEKEDEKMDEHGFVDEITRRMGLQMGRYESL